MFFFSKKFSGKFPQEFLPAKEGDFHLKQSFDIPQSPIHGKPSVTITLKDQNNKQITCLKLSVKI